MKNPAGEYHWHWYFLLVMTNHHYLAILRLQCYRSAEHKSWWCYSVDSLAEKFNPFPTNICAGAVWTLETQRFERKKNQQLSLWADAKMCTRETVPLPPKLAAGCGVVLVEVQAQQELAQVGAGVVTGHAGQNAEQDVGLPLKTLQHKTRSIA